MMRRPVLCLALLLAAAACGDCKGDPDPGDAGVLPLPFGALCTASTECASGLCLGSGICSKPCQSNADCPAFEPWACTDVAGVPRCTCALASVQDACNLVDDDCNGVVDDGQPACVDDMSCVEGECQCPAERQCGDLCADLQNDARHCGGCDNECAVGSACVDGECACAGEVCNGACVDLGSDAVHCGACGVSCFSHEECVEGECESTDLEWARWTGVNTNIFVTEGGHVRDQSTGLLWQGVAANAAFSWQEARAHCGAMNTPPLDGKADNVASPGRPWRLPTRIELLSIVDYSKHLPALPDDVFTSQDGPRWGPFWTATLDASDEERAWVVNFDRGNVDTFPIVPVPNDDDPDFLIRQFVRCVK